MLNFVNDQPTEYVESVAAVSILRVCSKVGVFCLRFEMRGEVFVIILRFYCKYWIN